MKNHDDIFFVPTYAGPLIQDLRLKRGFLGQHKVLTRDHLPTWIKGKIVGVVIHVHSLEDAALVMREIEESEDKLCLVKSPDELLEVSKNKNVAVMLCASFDDVGFNPNLLTLYDSIGVVSFALSLNDRNLLTDGCAEHSGSGLSAKGYRVVKELFQRGILIDVSHTSDKGFWDVMKTVDSGVIASHSNARALCDNPRNLLDDMIIAIAQQDGVVGISTYPTLLTDSLNPTTENALDHIEYIKDLVGVNYISVGADFIDYALDIILPKIKMTDFEGRLYGVEHAVVDGLGGYKDLPNIIRGMRKRGFEEEDIKKITSGNFLRVWRNALERGLH